MDVVFRPLIHLLSTADLNASRSLLGEAISAMPSEGFPVESGTPATLVSAAGSSLAVEISWNLLAPDLAQQMAPVAEEIGISSTDRAALAVSCEAWISGWADRGMAIAAPPGSVQVRRLAGTVLQGLLSRPPFPVTGTA